MKKLGLAIVSLFALSTVASAFVFPPQMLNVHRGRIVSGGLFSLFESDNDRLVVENGIKTSPYDNPVDVEGEVVCGSSNPAAMSLVIESAATTLGLVEYVEMWDWSLNRYVEVYRGPITLSDTVRQVQINQCQRFTAAGGQMKVRYWVDNRGPVVAGKWRVGLDQLNWDVTF
ncbi:MAG: hypothetical protein KIT11_07735 [Fimbriimonadaceae bacterium]|nr:hypothetical protein [Fimbriimonadaceae bacterium]QYK56244.1 MAG: hypothetical protein KF733_01925 [Fimbriimonadaceae bacterium]